MTQIHGNDGLSPIQHTQAIKSGPSRTQLATIEKTNAVGPDTISDQGDAAVPWTDNPVSQPISQGRDVKLNSTKTDPELKKFTALVKKELKTINQAPQTGVEGKAQHPEQTIQTKKKGRG